MATEAALHYCVRQRLTTHKKVISSYAQRDIVIISLTLLILCRLVECVVTTSFHLLLCCSSQRATPQLNSSVPPVLRL